ncbi:spore coat U domain-containing protein [Rugamonas sp.]|uniref:Csu type fimbrial protein n=1 Tax=Rugamonas sp. TaxID=1926287 RepID=UPI0025DE2E3E|nr:spore coat U domain-containing protein [Rugamonas sp.]
MLSTCPSRVLPLAVALSALCFASADAAVYSNGNKTTSFDTTLQIIADCTINAVPLDFGQTQGVLATAVTINTTIGVTCTNTTLYNLGLNAGNGTGSTISARTMSGTGGNTGTIAYNLSLTAGGGNWGNTQGTDTKSGTGSGTLQTVTVYGQVPPQLTPAPDTYKSTITATVYF